MRKASLYVTVVIVAALLASTGLYVIWPGLAAGAATALVVLSVLAAVAELLAWVLPQSSSGSIAFIPYLAAIIVAPSWAPALAVAAVRAVVDRLAGRRGLKAAFNVAQHVLSQCIAVFVYRGLGGTSLLEIETSSLQAATVAIGLPAVVSIVVALIANKTLVSGAIALSTNNRFVTIWRTNSLATIGLDLAAGPLIFVFAWVYTSFGPIAAAALWVPILGLRQVYTANLELEKTNRELLQLMVKSIEARDPYTSGHSRRVQHYSTIIARALHLNESDIERVGRAALLHDVGKIYEKYAPILRKTEKLSSEEWVTMKEHPIDSANLVATMTGLKELVPAVRHHHENWDGSGYPDGLSGEQIPLYSRIIAFADTMDAMTTERPYRPALSEADVRAELERCKGKQFDPRLTEKLLNSPLWEQLFLPPRSGTPSAPSLAIVRRANRRPITANAG